MKKLTDEQIIKYWNEIDSEIINEHGEEFDVYITMPVAKSTADLISRQKAEIERLGNQNTLLLKKKCKDINTARKIIKSEAIKEFAERLKEHSFVDNLSLDGKETVYVDDIDKLVKEMTEGK